MLQMILYLMWCFHFFHTQFNAIRLLDCVWEMVCYDRHLDVSELMPEEESPIQQRDLSKPPKVNIRFRSFQDTRAFATCYVCD